MKRRYLLASAASAIAPLVLRDARAQGGGDDFDISNPMPDPIVLGTQKALKEEIETAKQLMEAAPRTTPLAVFSYFESLNERNRDGEPYNAGWTTRWNPVLLFFFEDVGLKAQPKRGDQTPWCAASLNWTLQRCGMLTTGSAFANSFFNAVGKTDTPKEGDIVAFADPADKMSGHVGIFIERTATGIVVLGGNQTPRRSDAARHNVLNRGPIPDKYPNLKFQSYHSIEAFRS